VTVLLLAGLHGAVSGSDFRRDWEGIQDSLHRVPPKQREWWLHKRGLGDLLAPQGSTAPESVGLSMVGKFGRGPSVEVTGQDTLVALSLGSEVALVSFANPDSPRVLSEIQLSSMAGQAQLAGSRLYINSAGTFEVWDISSPANPVQRGRIPYDIGDFWVNDTFLYFIKNDTFKVLSITDPASPRQLGAYRDSGYFLAATPNTAILGDPDAGLYFVDITNPASPHRAGSFPAEIPRSAAARGNLCCATFESRVEPYPIRFVTVDISNPTNPHQLGQLNNAGGYDLYLDGPYAFASGRGPSGGSFQIVDIADTLGPQLIGNSYLSGYKYGVWSVASSRLALVANEMNGLAVIEITDPAHPQFDTAFLGAGAALDVHVRGSLCFVADEGGGLKIVDIADPTRPSTIGELDTLGEVEACYSVVTDDSFAYIGWFNAPMFHVADVTDPAAPRLVAACEVFEYAQDMVMRDSFIYAADNYKFEVLNVARPRDPRVVGTLNLPERSREVVLVDTLAYVANFGGLLILNVADPRNPRQVGYWGRLAYGIALQDTIAYLATYRGSTEDVMLSLNVANPAAPSLLDSVVVPRAVQDVVVADTIAYLGGYGCGLMMVDVADPANMRLLSEGWSPPSWIRRLVYAAPYIYACCTDGGVSILETLQTGILEDSRKPSARLRVWPSVTTGRVCFADAAPARWTQVRAYDALGAEAARVRLAGVRPCSGEIDLGIVPDGVYLLRFEADRGSHTTKIVKTTRR